EFIEQRVAVIMGYRKKKWGMRSLRIFFEQKIAAIKGYRGGSGGQMGVMWRGYGVTRMGYGASYSDVEVVCGGGTKYLGTKGGDMAILKTERWIVVLVSSLWVKEVSH
nr:hypothetical protein [Tanacetum cinerariifolium]